MDQNKDKKQIKDQKLLEQAEEVKRLEAPEDITVNQPPVITENNVASPTPNFTPNDIDPHDSSKDVQPTTVPQADTQAVPEQESIREQVIQSVYLGDQPIIGGVKIRKKTNPLSDLKKKIKPPHIGKTAKIIIPIVMGVILLALSGGAYLALRTDVPPSQPTQPPQENPQQTQKIKIIGNFTFPARIEEDPIIMKLVEIQSEPIDFSIKSMSSISVDSLDSELKSIKFE